MHMLSVIKTAIITIIISFISGVLLDSYKNFAPRILCTMGKPVRLKMNDKKIWAFTLIMRNISNKTIHNLDLNIQGHYDNLRIDDAEITKGLKFETASESNNYNISIPFLSKNDELSVKIFVESLQGKIRKPIVTLRSPEDFKRVDSTGQNGYLATLAGIPKDISDSITKRKYRKQNTDNDDNRIHGKEKRFSNHKKAVIAIAGILLVIYAGILGNEYFDKVAGKMTTSNDKTNAQQTGASLGKTNSVSEGTSSSAASTSSTPGNTQNIKAASEKSQNTDKDEKTNTKSSGNTKNDTKAVTTESKNAKTGSNSKNGNTAASTSSTESTDKDSSSNSNIEDDKTNGTASVTQKSESDKQSSDNSKNTTEKQPAGENIKTQRSNDSVSNNSSPAQASPGESTK